MITMTQAVAAYRTGNNAGLGYAPYRDIAGDDTIEDAVRYATAEGWELVLARHTPDDVAVLKTTDHEWMAIGGDARGRNAWAVDITQWVNP